MPHLLSRLKSFTHRPHNLISESECKHFVLAWLYIGNPLVLMWHCYYISATVNPLRDQKRATDYTLSQFEFGFICFLGAFLIIINGTCGFFYFLLPLWQLWSHRRFLRLNTIRVPHTFRKTVFAISFISATALTIFFTFAQFVSPFLASELYWKTTYRHVCDGMDVRVYLDASRAHPARDTKFVNSATNEVFTMRMDPDPFRSIEDAIKELNMNITMGADRWLPADPGAGYTLSMVTGAEDRKNENSTFVPEWAYVRFNEGLNFGEMTYQMFNAADEMLLFGTFKIGRNFSVPSLYIHGNLGPFMEHCVFDPVAVIYSVDPLGDQMAEETVAMRTVQYSICAPLQLCSHGLLGDMLPVPVGLVILQRARRGLGCCRTENRVAGVEGRGKD